MIRRNFTFLNQDILLRLYIAFVRPHLEYAQAVWSPTNQTLINKIEKVQERALNLIPEIRSLSYSEQLSITKLPTLVYRRLRGDMIDVYKHISEEDGYDHAVFCESFETNSRPQRLLHNFQLRRIYDSSPLVARMFYSRVREPWNNLPKSVANSNNINSFKNKIDAHWIDLPIRTDHEAPPPYRIRQT